MTNHDELLTLFKENTGGKTVTTPKPEPSENEVYGYQRSRVVIRNGMFVEEEKE
jgi:hypothetical protein